MDLTVAGKRIPKFPNEEAEAAWYDEHKSELQEYLKPKRKGARPLTERLGVEPQEKTASRLVSIRLPEKVIEEACAVAEAKGIGYQTLLKMLIREALFPAQEERGAQEAAIQVRVPASVKRSITRLAESEGVDLQTLLTSLLTRVAILGEKSQDAPEAHYQDLRNVG